MKCDKNFALNCDFSAEKGYYFWTKFCEAVNAFHMNLILLFARHYAFSEVLFISVSSI